MEKFKAKIFEYFPKWREILAFLEKDDLSGVAKALKEAHRPDGFSGDEVLSMLERGGNLQHVRERHRQLQERRRQLDEVRLLFEQATASQKDKMPPVRPLGPM